MYFITAIIKHRLIAKLIAGIVIISTMFSLLSNGDHSYDSNVYAILMMIIGGATALLFTKES